MKWIAGRATKYIHIPLTDRHSLTAVGPHSSARESEELDDECLCQYCLSYPVSLLSSSFFLLNLINYSSYWPTSASALCLGECGKGNTKVIESNILIFCQCVNLPLFHWGRLANRLFACVISHLPLLKLGGVEQPCSHNQWEWVRNFFVMNSNAFITLQSHPPLYPASRRRWWRLNLVN